MKTQENKKQEIRCYSNILEDFTKLKDTGLFSNERIQEIADYLTEDKFGPVKLENGRQIKDWYCHYDTGEIFNGYTFNNSKHYVNGCILNSFLPQEEIIKINELADKLWSEKREKERFEKAQKVNEKDWTGRVYLGGCGYNDGYFESIEDFYDWAEEEDIGDIDYVWAVDEVRQIVDFDVDQVLEQFTEDVYEDFDYRDLDGIPELKAAIEKFVKLNEGHSCFYSNEKIAVILDKK